MQRIIILNFLLFLRYYLFLIIKFLCYSSTVMRYNIVSNSFLKYIFLLKIKNYHTKVDMKRHCIYRHLLIIEIAILLFKWANHKNCVGSAVVGGSKNAPLLREFFEKLLSPDPFHPTRMRYLSFFLNTT